MSESSANKRRAGLPQRVRMRHTEHYVEELSSRSETPVGKMVPLSEIEPDPNQPRTTIGDLQDLVSSIRDKGVLEPLLVRTPNDLPTGKNFRIISGERRYQASLEAGMYEVPVIVLEVDADEALEIALIENLQRKDLTPFEEAEGYQALADRHGYTHEQISEAVGKSRTVITETLQLLKMPPKVRDAVLALGVNSKSVLQEILKAKSEEEMIQLLEKAATLGLSRDDLRRRTRRRTSTRRKPYTFAFKAPDKSYRLNLTFRRSTVERTDLIQALQEILEQLRQEESEGPGEA